MSCKSRIIHWAVFATSLFAIGLPSFAAEPLQSTLDDLGVGERWHYNDWETAKAAAENSKKPILALFR